MGKNLRFFWEASTRLGVAELQKGILGCGLMAEKVVGLHPTPDDIAGSLGIANWQLCRCKVTL